MDGERIVYERDRLKVPDRPAVLFIEGDGIGPDIWKAARPVIDAAVRSAYGGSREIFWNEVYAGEKAFNRTGQWLPEETIGKIREYKVAVKGPLTTPVGGGIRSLNVAMRKTLGLYANVRPVRYMRGVPSPVREPQRVDMVVFRENLEDVYTGIEWKSGTEEAREIIRYINSRAHLDVDENSGIGFKPMSEKNSKNLIRRAIRFALEKGRRSVTLVHKGNIMKYTEGAFREWGYELAREEFPDSVITEGSCRDAHNGAPPEGTVVLMDRTADDMFQQVLIHPQRYDVIASTNLNGDYLSDALAAQVGGVGIAPGGNFGDTEAVFESVHGTAPGFAGKDVANPSALILTGEMMLRFFGWNEAADLVRNGLEKTILQKRVTQDLALHMPGTTALKCSEFGKAVEGNISQGGDAGTSSTGI